MMRRYIVLLLMFVPYAINGAKYSGPKGLGPFDIDRTTRAKELFKRLGAPAAKAAPYCYRSKNENLFINIQTIHSQPDDAAEVFLERFS